MKPARLAGLLALAGALASAQPPFGPPGTVLNVVDEAGVAQRLRIDAITPDPRDRSGDIFLYDLKTQNDAGDWVPYCQPDAQGLQAALFLPDDASDAVRITCTAGAIGKCVRLGYHPWKLAPDGRPMRDYHAACTRMMRAEYCGDGQAFTEDGTLVDVFDAIGVQAADNPPGTSFEAAWGAHGAVCVRRTRKPGLLTPAQLEQRCPQVKVSEACGVDAPGGLVFNSSRP